MVEKALADVARDIAIRPHYDNFIGGRWVAAVRGETFGNISPVDGRVICTVARSTAEDVELALDAAHAAREAWGRTPPAQRALVMLRIADRIEQRLDLLAMVETIDNGKPIRETTAADLPLAVDHFRYFAGCLRAQEGSLSEIDHDTVAYHFHEPLGVVAQIIPWNFPLLMAVWKLAPALAAGNCVVLKPAEQTPMSIMVLAEMIGDLLPPGVLNIVNGFGVEAGKPLAQSPRIAKVAFTGETTTGRLIMQYASENIIPVTLELGGKSPNIFFADVMAEDDDFFDKALEGFSMFALNQGEVCTCPSRALVHESIYDRFMERAVARVGQMKLGNPLDPQTMVGAQASNDQLQKILSYLDIGRQEGAKVLAGGGACGGRCRSRGRLLHAADRAGGPQRDADLPGGDLRPGAVGHHVPRRGGGPVARQRHAVRPRCRRVDPRWQSRLPDGARDPGRPGVDQLLPPVSGACGVRRLQEVGHRARDAQDDARSLPADQEPAGQLLSEGARFLLREFGMVERVVATEAAIAMIARLRARHGDLMFHQSGGCCDGSSPMCYPAGEFRTGAQDVLLGTIGGADMFIARDQHAAWAHTQLIIDVVVGRGGGFSLEAPEGVRFLTRGRVFSQAELEEVAAGG